MFCVLLVIHLKIWLLSLIDEITADFKQEEIT